LGFWREWVGRSGGHAAKTGRFALFLPWVETQGYQIGQSAGVLRTVVLRMIGSWVEFRQLVDRVWWLQINL